MLSCPHFIDWEDIEPAVREACKTAMESKRRATFGYAEGQTTINVNRCYKTAKGWQQISNWHGNTDHTLPVMRFDDEQGNPIAILYVANTAAGMLENAMNSTKKYADGTTGKTRQVSCDIAGLSSRYIEKYYGNGCVALYFCGCTGDQWCETRAENNYLTVSPKDNIEFVEKTYLPIDALLTDVSEVSRCAPARGFDRFGFRAGRDDALGQRQC